ncbi:heterokaryon incompatibility protein-domain-containing protein [Xylaria palmicola]|nr:heterokaryon incompatibility protein-domain-containing protein [Xylaria palmicola]
MPKSNLVSDATHATWLETHSMLLEWSAEVYEIVDGLCQRNSRFQFIRESITAFRSEEGSLLASLRDPIHNVNENHASQSNRTPESSKGLLGFAIMTLTEIVDEAIYELLDAFRIHLPVERVPQKLIPYKHIELLRSLYEQSKNEPLKPAGNAATENPQNIGQGRYHASLYPDNLISLSKETSSTKIRVLHLAPGSGESCIEGNLEVRDLEFGQIDEALSYVWGTSRDSKLIRINGQPFAITQSLHTILVSLRDQHVKRTIWIDAICINQSDSDEKAHQVQHMGEIYSTAKKTTIWLSDRTPESSYTSHTTSVLSRRTNNISDVLAPLPKEFHGFVADQYDLVSILAKLPELDPSKKVGKQHLALFTNLAQCMNAIMACEWWERVWTIQEATLPPQHPQFIYHGHVFSYEDFKNAEEYIKNFISRIQEESPEKIIRRECVTVDESNIFARNTLLQQVYWQTYNSGPLLGELRPAELSPMRYLERYQIHWLLCKSAAYKATDPRDKYFALQGLLPRSKGALVYVDYSKSKEAIFKRATARCYNASIRLDMTSTFNLLVEKSQEATDQMASSYAGADYTQCGPSWVHDFTYSDVVQGGANRGEPVTFLGHLYKPTHAQPRYPSSMKNVVTCFATPTTLFCSGVSFSAVRTTGYVPNFDGKDITEQYFAFIKQVVVQQNKVDMPRLNSNEASEQEKKMPLLVELCFSYFQRTTTNDSEQRKADIKAALHSLNPDEVLILEGLIPQIKENLEFFGLEDISIKGLFSSKEKRKFLEAVSGMQYFTAEHTLIGIATAPVMEGDILAVLDPCPTYFVFREVKSDDGVVRHRMIARAVVNKERDRMKDVLSNTKGRTFEII